ncbi:hypothetical protein PGT21_020085 [Puccinia graminis f. sp. tritici]|uniref:Uncharacterized protein n=1 Tax=Puccinia graminis f. sp. tritici TaxID=56615 RepID=A0A5B0QIZ4_PUCGR|nr:hypothetical protein PGT21_020085 [Puccinia graminis f. sp. tritici]
MCMNGPKCAIPRCPPMYEFSQNSGILVTHIYRGFPGSSLPSGGWKQGPPTCAATSSDTDLQMLLQSPGSPRLITGVAEISLRFDKSPLCCISTTSTEIEPPFRSTAVTRQANNAKPSHRRPPGAHLHSLDPVDTVPG